MKQPTDAPDGVPLLISGWHRRGDIVRDKRGRAWLWEGNDTVPMLTRCEDADDPSAQMRRQWEAMFGGAAPLPLEWYLSQIGDA